MYTKFFGLNEKPFAITPDPRYLFMSERHGEGLAHLVYGVTDSGGFIQLTGEVGTGKTTLVRTLLGKMPDEADVALILNPQVTVLEFLQGICRELGVPLPDDRNSAMALVDALNRHLLDAHARGRRIILLVDEAQNLSEEVLEQLRLLTNLETAKQKLLQIILIGQPELRDVLAQNNLRQLAQRVTGRYHLEPLSRDEAIRYIDHRMKVAGGLTEIFDLRAKQEIYRLSGGIPRIMNVICDRALLGAYSTESRKVDRNLVKKAASEVSGQPPAPWPWRSVAIALTVAAVAMIGAAFLQTQDRAEPPPAVAAPEPGPEIVPSPEATVTAVSAEPEPAETVAAAEARAPLEEALMSGELAASPDSGIANLLSLWGVDHDPNGGPGCARAEANGLSCLWQRGSWNVIRQLDRPAILVLTDRSGNSYEPLLTALGESEAELAFGDTRQSFALQEISSLWFGQFMIVWRPPVGSVSSLAPGMRSTKVAWLRESLATLGHDAPTTDPADADYYDAGLEQQVRAFQRQHRLQVDGLAGQHTQIIINSMLGLDNTPRLPGGG